MAQVQDSLTLARLIGSRICHDLISPVGAIANGMELVALSGGADTPELELISGSVDGANARIKFYRVALGMASPAQSMGASEISGILSGFYKDTRLTCNWGVAEDVPRDEVQAAFLALLCLANAMPTGGALTVSREGGSWSVTGAADQLNAHPHQWSALQNGGACDALQPSEVQFALLPHCSEALGRSLSSEIGETQATIRF